MPTKTFLNLSKEKQDKIVKAGIEEFSKELLSDASINMIIKKTGISRGSFYMYFSGKEDLYFYILDTYKEKIFSLITKTLIKNNGQLIDSVEELFYYIVSNLDKTNLKEFLKKVFLNMNYLIENKLLDKNKPLLYEKGIMSLINSDNYRINSNEELHSILRLLCCIVVDHVSALINQVDKKEIIMASFKKQIDIIRYGLYKGECV